MRGKKSPLVALSVALLPAVPLVIAGPLPVSAALLAAGLQRPQLTHVMLPSLRIPPLIRFLCQISPNTGPTLRCLWEPSLNSKQLECKWHHFLTYMYS